MQAGTDRCPELSPEQRETYWRKGYIAVRSVLGGQNIDSLRQECERLSSLPDSFDPFVPPRKTLDGREVRERLDAATAPQSSATPGSSLNHPSESVH